MPLCCRVLSCRAVLACLPGISGAARKFVRRYQACEAHMLDDVVDLAGGPQRYCQARTRLFLFPAEATKALGP